MSIDVHVHPLLVKELTDKRPSLLQDARELFDLRTNPQPLSTLLDEMKVCGIERSILLPIDCHKIHDSKMPSNDEAASLVRQKEKQLVGFASVDPDSGQAAVAEMRRVKDELGFRGLKLNPALQEFDPAGSAALEVYKEAERLELPILVHTGLTFSNRFSIHHNQPLIYDDIARKHPKLKICLAHMGWPWLWDAVTVAIRNPNVYLDTAATYVGTPAEHVRQITTTLSSRVIENVLGEQLMFGSDFPRIEMNKMYDAVTTLPIRRDVLLAILGGNALAFLGEE
jgi:predicted TIM-barrel fold metal-dependent hydrolase